MNFSFWNSPDALNVVVNVIDYAGPCVELLIGFIAWRNWRKATDDVRAKRGEAAIVVLAIVAALLWVADTKLNHRLSILQQTEIGNNLGKIDPNNRPVTDIIVDVTLVLKGQVTERPNRIGPGASGFLWLCESNMDICHFGDWTALRADDYEPYTKIDTRGTNRGYDIHFHEASLGVDNFARAGFTPSMVTNGVSALRIEAYFIPRDAEVLEGMAQIIVNGGITKRFIVPAQKTSGNRDFLSIIARERSP